MTPAADPNSINTLTILNGPSSSATVAFVKREKSRFQEPPMAQGHLQAPLPRDIFRRYHSVKGLRLLKVLEIKKLVRRSHRLRKRVCVVKEKELLTCPLLLRGHGFLMVFKNKRRGGSHAVSLFRTLNGRFLYYDSKAFQPHPYLHKYLEMHQVPQWDVTVPDVRLQHDGFGTCAYHALTFLGYATSTIIEDEEELLLSFVIRMGPNTEGAAVEFVKRLLSETDTGIDLTFGPHSSCGPLVLEMLPKDVIPEKTFEFFWRRRWSQHLRFS